MQDHVGFHLRKQDDLEALKARVGNEYTGDSGNQDWRTSEAATTTDIFDGLIINKYCKPKGMFNDKRHIALGIGWDGLPVVREPHVHSVTPIVIIVYNLPPEVRCRRENLIIPIIIPGPNEPAEYVTWTRPLRRELLLLSRGIPNATDGALVDDNFTDSHILDMPVDIPELDYLRFVLHGWAITGIADQVAMNKMICFKGAGSKFVLPIHLKFDC